LATLAERLTDLVERFHAGNVNAAARAIGVPQPTLSRMASGDVLNPRHGALSKVAAYYGTTLDYLLRGVGDPPVAGRSNLALCRMWIANHAHDTIDAAFGLALLAAALREPKSCEPRASEPETEPEQIETIKALGEGFTRLSARIQELTDAQTVHQ
jgi:transcriptional regulator with XRE-family HTH domain